MRGVFEVKQYPSGSGQKSTAKVITAQFLLAVSSSDKASTGFEPSLQRILYYDNKDCKLLRAITFFISILNLLATLFQLLVLHHVRSLLLVFQRINKVFQAVKVNMISKEDYQLMYLQMLDHHFLMVNEDFVLDDQLLFSDGIIER